MNILKGIRLAHLLDRLASGCGVTASVEEIRRRDPAIQLIGASDRLFAGLLAKDDTDAHFKQRQQAVERETQFPGYRAELNKRRTRFGLPPL